MSGSGLESRIKPKLKSNLTNEFDEESTRPKVKEDPTESLKDRIAALKKQYDNDTEISTSMGELLIKTGIFGSFNVKDVTALTDNKALQAMTVEEMDLFLRRLQEVVKNVTKGGKLLGIHLHMEKNEVTRNNEWIQFILEQMEVTLIELEEKIEKLASGEDKQDENNIKLKKLKKQREELVTEKITIMVYYEELGLEGLIENIKEIQDFESMKVLKECILQGNQKLLQILSLLRINEEIKNDIRDALLNPNGKTKEGGIVDVMGWANSAVIVINRIRTRIIKVTELMYYNKSKELQDLVIDFNNLGDGGFKKIIAEVDKMQEQLEWFGYELVGNNSKKDFSGLIKKNRDGLFWDLLMKLTAGEVEKNKTASGKNFIKIRDRLVILCQSVHNSDETVEQKKCLLYAGLLEIDACTSYEPPEGKEDKEGWTLNVNDKGKKERSKDKGKYPKKEYFCNDVLRKGFCSKPGCKYKGMSQSEYNAREICPYEKSKIGSCKSRNYCMRLHPNDPEKMTEEMKKKCVHHGGGANKGSGESTNAAEEVETDKSGARE